PATNSTNMNSQQHPRQYAAWLSPIRSAPPRPDRQCRVTNIIGDWQWVRHTSFARVTSYTPAARRTAPGARAASPTIGPMRPRAASATRDSHPNTPQIKKYGTTESEVRRRYAGRVGRPASKRVIPWNATIMGSAAGNIIATIITTMSPKNNATPTAPSGAPITRNVISYVDVDHVRYHAATTRIATSTATGIVIRRRRSDAGSESPMAMARGDGDSRT